MRPRRSRVNGPSSSVYGLWDWSGPLSGAYRPERQRSHGVRAAPWSNEEVRRGAQAMRQLPSPRGSRQKVSSGRVECTEIVSRETGHRSARNRYQLHAGHETRCGGSSASLAVRVSRETTLAEGCDGRAQQHADGQRTIPERSRAEDVEKHRRSMPAWTVRRRGNHGTCQVWTRWCVQAPSTLSG
jgi:hypothetical protein